MSELVGAFEMKALPKGARADRMAFYGLRVLGAGSIRPSTGIEINAKVSALAPSSGTQFSQPPPYLSPLGALWSVEASESSDQTPICLGHVRGQHEQLWRNGVPGTFLKSLCSPGGIPGGVSPRSSVG